MIKVEGFSPFATKLAFAALIVASTFLSAAGAVFATTESPGGPAAELICITRAR